MNDDTRIALRCVRMPVQMGAYWTIPIGVSVLHEVSAGVATYACILEKAGDNPVGFLGQGAIGLKPESFSDYLDLLSEAMAQGVYEDMHLRGSSARRRAWWRAQAFIVVESYDVFVYGDIRKVAMEIP